MFRPLKAGPKVSSTSKNTEQEEPLMLKDPQQLVSEHVELELFISANELQTTEKGRGDMVTSQPTSPTRTMNISDVLDVPQRNTSLFRSEGALNRHTQRPGIPSPLTLDQSSTTQRSNFRRQYSEDHHRHMLTPGNEIQHL